MTITITRKDWKRGINYDLPCGCLLYRAVRRLSRQSCWVWPGKVEIGSKKYSYNTKIERRLIDAHRNPSLLPITITLK